MIRLRVPPLVIALALALTTAASALKIESVTWGFDGKVVAGRFNILSVLVSEHGPSAFDGEISLYETRGMEATVGAPQVQKIYVTQGTQRWVQFTPFVTSSIEWKLRWGTKENYNVAAPTLDAPATVVLLDPNSAFATPGKLKAFSEDLFPTSVAATDGLDQLVIDHTPRWDAPRREAFLDWLRRGGVVHLLRGPSGYPVFEDGLAILNTTLPRERVGVGTVARHEVSRAECDDAFLQRAGFPLRGRIEGEKDYASFHGFHQVLLQKLAGITKPDVQWWLLYLLTIAYLILIGPVHYRWSRKIDYRVAIAGFLGTVAAFAIAFIFAGSRGAGETQTTHSVAIARSLGEKRWDVMQWISAFATTGDMYRLTHRAPSNLYAAPSESEGVSGYIVNGKDGYLEVDIPLYSSRPFVHRAAMTGPTSGVQVLEWKRDRVVLQPGPDFPSDIMECRARRGDTILTLESDGSKWVWDQKSKPLTSLDDFFDATKLKQLSYEHSGEFEPEKAFIPLAAAFFGDVKGMPDRISTRPMSADQMQLLVFAKAPESFAMQGKGFRGEKGWVLYVIDLFRPAS